jgi:hypothetical protein
MMIEIISREKGEGQERKKICRGNYQVSYNSDGRLVLRIIHDKARDTLIVCDSVASDEIIGFCQHKLAKVRDPDIPF